MARPSKKLALFLCLIVLHQDFIQARSSHNEMVSSSSRFRPRRSSRDILEEDRHELDQAVKEIEARHGISMRSDLGRPLQRDRRFFGLFIFIVSIVVTVAATVVETIYDIAGCCGLGFGYLCDFESNFNKRKEDLTRKAEVVDKRLEDALTKRDDLECLAEVLKSLWGSVNELVKLQEKLLGNIDPTFKNILLKRERDIRSSLANASAEIDENEVSLMFTKLTGEELALKLTVAWSAAAVPGISYLGAKAYKSYKINKFYKILKASKLDQVVKAAPKARKLIGFTETTAKVFLKNTAIMKFSGKAGSFLKAMKFFKVAGAVMSIVSIAMDLFNIITTFIGCKEKSDKARESCGELEKAEGKVTQTRNDVTAFENLLRDGLEAQLKKELKNTDLHSALENIKDTIVNLPAPKNTVDRDIDIDYCRTAIPRFIERVKQNGVPIKDIKNDMLDIIDNCVDKLKFSYKCLKERLEINTRIRCGCITGDKTFDEILSEEKLKKKIVLDQCKAKNEPYTTDEMFQEALVAASRQKGMGFYSENCKMNSLMNVESICEGNRVDGFTDAQRNKIITEKCKGGKPPKLPVSEQREICINIKFLESSPQAELERMKKEISDLKLEDITSLDCDQLLEDQEDEEEADDELK